MVHMIGRNHIKNFMKYVLSALIALFLPATAQAQVSCTEIGSLTSCSDGKSYNQIGNTLFGSDGSSYTRIGSTIFGSDGTSYSQIGNSYFGSDGSSYTKIGSTIFGSDGSSLSNIGDSSFLTGKKDRPEDIEKEQVASHSNSTKKSKDKGDTATFLSTAFGIADPVTIDADGFYE